MKRPEEVARAKEAVERAVAQVITIAARWAHVADNPVAQENASQLEDGEFLRDLVDRVENFERTRTLTRMFDRQGKGPPKGLPTTREHLDALRLRNQVAATVRSIRKHGDLGGGLARIGVGLTAAGKTGFDAKLQEWSRLASKGSHGFTPVAAADALLSELGVAKPRRLAQTQKAAKLTAGEIIHSAPIQGRALTYAVQCLGLASRPHAEELVRRFFVHYDKRKRPRKDSK